MALDRECFRACVRRQLNWRTWIAIGIIAIVAFILAFFTWGLSLWAALAWIAVVYGASIATILGTCFWNCNRG